MDRSKRRGYPLRRWLRLDEGPRVRRRSLARREQPDEPDSEEHSNMPERYRDAAGVMQGGRDGHGWQRYGGDESHGVITFMNRRD